jgi:hypothetical protein
MSRCVVCNSKITKREYFCEKCLKKEIGSSSRRRLLGAVAGLAALPFGTVHWGNSGSDGDKVEWVIDRTISILKDNPQYDDEAVMESLAREIGLESNASRREALRRIRDTKIGPLWAPWDIVLQFGMPVSLIAVLLGLVTVVLRSLG